MGKILSYAYLLAIAVLAGAYGQSNLRQSLHAFLGYQHMWVEDVTSAFRAKDIGPVEVQTISVVNAR